MVPIYEELKGWQGGIGSLLGFVALMVAALWNFRLNRRRDAMLRAEEALSVAAALYGEIVLLRIEIARIARDVARIEAGSDRDIDKHFLEAHALPEPTLYKALAAKIGLLSADLVIAITGFHKNYQEVRTWLPLLIENPERGYYYSRSYLLVPARDAIYDIVPALRKIEQLASISEGATDPELGLTDDIIEWEEERSRRRE
jgi:hypothetical protein